MSLNQLGILQQLSRALMQPLIALPAAALALAFGHLLAGAGLQDTAALFELTGRTIFYVLPYIFAVGVALGLANNAGVAALSALLGIFIFRQLLNQWSGSAFEPTVLNGIIFGILAGLVHQRFKDVRFPEYLQFLEASDLRCSLRPCARSLFPG